MTSTSQHASRDRCSMAVGSRPTVSRRGARGPEVAIDARWLWDRDAAISPASPAGSRSRSMLEMTVGSRRGVGCGSIAPESCRDRCSMAVGSRHSLANRAGELQAVAIDARWLWDRDADDRHLRSRPRRVAIDARWLWDRDNDGRCNVSTSATRVAIDARWLWDRDRPAPRVPVGQRAVAIDARWLWDRDSTCRSCRPSYR